MRLFPNRKTDTPDSVGPWQVWRWFDIMEGDECLLSRLVIFRCPWFQVLLHWIHRPDAREDLHDHPWSFWGVVLDGHYTEVRGQPVDDRLENVRLRKVNFFIHKNTTEAHGIASVSDGGAITLLFTGPPRKSWSFFTPIGQGRMIQTHWKDRYK